MARRDSYVIDKDKGYARIVRSILGGFHNGKIRVGWFAGAGKGTGGVLIPQYAMWNEYGMGVPERPFMRRAFDENLGKYHTEAGKLEWMVMKGTLTFEGLLWRLGMMARNDVVLSITDARNWAIPNAPATIRRKGSSSPLIDTAAMRNSVWFEVTSKKMKKQVFRG